MININSKITKMVWVSEDEKYTVSINTDGSEFEAFRYGEKWRSLAGDSLVYNLFHDLIHTVKAMELMARDTLGVTSICTDESLNDLLTHYVKKARDKFENSQYE